MCFACSPKVPAPSALKLVHTFNLKIPEPSGIAIYNNHLFIVSDKNGTIYKCTLRGATIEKIRSKNSDLEGITIDPVSKQLIVVNEAKRTLIYLNFEGTFMKEQRIKGNQKKSNSGLEGICYDTSKNSMYVLNEKAPKQLLELNSKGEITTKTNLNFSNDVSGICYDKNTNSFWVVSDESKAIYQISKKGILQKKYKTGIVKGEGIAIYNNKIFVVSDALKKLYVFEIVN